MELLVFSALRGIDTRTVVAAAMANQQLTVEPIE